MDRRRADVGVMIQALAVPDVIIGGAPRSGTTFMCELLARHPGIFFARPFIPEPKVCLTAHPRGDAGLIERYEGYFGNAPPNVVKIEKTANYFENAEARARLVRVLPHAKFIFILREPVARAYSNWLWSGKNGLETLPFEEAIRLEGIRASPLPPDRAYARPFDYMSRGRYGSLAEKWIRVVGRDRIAFWIFEKAIADPDAFVQELLDYIGVEQLPWELLRTGRVNATESEEAGPDETLAAVLRGRIAPEVRYFAEVSGVDVSIWGY